MKSTFALGLVMVLACEHVAGAVHEVEGEPAIAKELLKCIEIKSLLAKPSDEGDYLEITFGTDWTGRDATFQALKRISEKGGGNGYTMVLSYTWRDKADAKHATPRAIKVGTVVLPSNSTFRARQTLAELFRDEKVDKVTCVVAVECAVFDRWPTDEGAREIMETTKIGEREVIAARSRDGDKVKYTIEIPKSSGAKD